MDICLSFGGKSADLCEYRISIPLCLHESGNPLGRKKKQNHHHHLLHCLPNTSACGLTTSSVALYPEYVYTYQHIRAVLYGTRAKYRVHPFHAIIWLDIYPKCMCKKKRVIRISSCNGPADVACFSYIFFYQPLHPRTRVIALAAHLLYTECIVRP